MGAVKSKWPGKQDLFFICLLIKFLYHPSHLLNSLKQYEIHTDSPLIGQGKMGKI